MRGNKKLNTASSAVNSLNFAISQQLLMLNTLEPVKILEVGTTLKVQPLVSILNGDGDPITPSPIYDIPYLGVQNGTNGIIIPPSVGDIGLVGYCQRNIDSIKATKNKSSPENKRTFSQSDGIYLFTIVSMNEAPTRNLIFSDEGIEINGGEKTTINGNGATVTVDNMVSLSNSMQSLATLIQSFLTACENIATGTDATPVPLTPSAKAAFTNLKPLFSELLK